MKINNYDEDYLEELENEEYKYKYKKRDKKLKESFKFEDLLTKSQVEKLLNYCKRGM